MAIRAWDSYERSRDFQSVPILTAADDTATLKAGYTAWITKNRAVIAETKRLEEENNRLFIDAYGLQDEPVKVNYGRFGDLLAKVNAVHGKKPEVL